MSNLIHTPMLADALRYGGQTWELIRSTEHHAFTFNGSLTVLAWERKPNGGLELVGTMYVPDHGGMYYQLARRQAHVWEEKRMGRMVTLSYVISGQLNHMDVDSSNVLDVCDELIKVHGGHVKHLAVYLGDERLWQYNNRTRKEAR